MFIQTALDLPQVQRSGYQVWIESTARGRWPRWTGRILWQTQGQVRARINHSRWIADCPQEGCGGAIWVAPGLPFFCPECLNRGNGGFCYEVIFPTEMREIEDVLDQRIAASTRNWFPGEALQKLIAENHAHGIFGG